MNIEPELAPYFKAGNELNELLPRLTSDQREFLLERWKGTYRSNKACALALGLHPNTPCNWRYESTDFKRAEDLMGQAMFDALRLAQFYHIREGFARQYQATLERKKHK